MAQLRGLYPVAMMCRVLQVSRSKFHAWLRTGGMTARQCEDVRLTTLIRAVHKAWGGIFGYRRMRDCLRDLHDEEVGERRIKRLMREAELAGLPAKKRKAYRKPVVDPDVPDLVQRDFTASQPNEKWVSDITEFRTREGKLYLCMIKDLYDGLVVAWETGSRQTAALVVDTVNRAVEVRLDQDRPILHSDHGSQYTSHAYRECLTKHGLSISMGKVKTCADNATAESVFGQFKRELINVCQFDTNRQAIRRIDHYFVTVFNPLKRLALNRKTLDAIAKMDHVEPDELT